MKLEFIIDVLNPQCAFILFFFFTFIFFRSWVHVCIHIHSSQIKEAVKIKITNAEQMKHLAF